jgi:hypothetical protein
LPESAAWVKILVKVGRGRENNRCENS